MKNKEDNELSMVEGGTSITGTLVSAFADAIKTLFDVGKSLGNSIRRLSGGNICPMP